ncbi:MAG: helix-turn-helix transcriptional regulator [Firmicutes bacterium]|nr:helix-turn-helix transcriptional regulator [Bacillota bacterium]
MKLHEKLKVYINKHGITQTFVANQAEISVKTLNNILLGRQRLNADMFELICRKGLGINPGIFFKEKFLETKTNKDEDIFTAATGTEN